MDGVTYSNQVYMMVVNGLTDPTGIAADCLQTINLDFSNLSGSLTNLIMLDPLTGRLQTNGLPVFSTKRRLSLRLNGGDAVLFKFNTGAPFVGFYSEPARLTARLQGGQPTFSIEGTVGTQYEVQITSSLASTNWTTLTNLLLPSSPHGYTDATTAGATTRFYRTVAR